MTLEPALIALMFEDVIVQKSPARPVYAEQFFVTWRAPPLWEDSNDKPSRADFSGAVESEQAVMATEVVMAVAMRNLKRIMSTS
jgi:hypothetical protein